MKEEKEIWKPCPGYERWYDVSNFGNVRSYHVIGSLKRKIVPTLLKPHIETYIRVNLSKGIGVQKYHSLHILVATLFVKNPFNRKFVHHKDNDKLNPRASNLEWVTKGQNQKYAYADGVKKRPNGTLNGRSKLSESEVIEIFKSDKNIYELASIYNVTKTAVNNIRNGKIWSSLTGKKYELIGLTLLTDQQVLEILNSNLHQIKLAKKYKISQSRVSAIKTGRSYSEITGIKFKGKREYIYFGLKSALKKAV